MWLPNYILFPIGLFFLRQAKNDSRLLEADFFAVLIDRFKQSLRKNKEIQK
jgi:lipopolysaccharide export system permease protein